ncbi:DUF3299 domain-containing protein [Winogradskyella aurantiaca]|uniref:DUF3299 domain-containing protein n=1 Tax=Winogradskyella aurantiaca TaxID=2219558 RepID=UPI000E1D1C2A|nr:DUF3299 domain-containing protein [Winogradskyella aurantiaca]
MRSLFLIILISTFSILGAQEVKLITWKDLEAPVDFEDPYEKLELKQLQQLGELAYYREIEAMDKSELTKYELSRKDSIIKWLKADKIDYEYLFEIRPKVEAMRAKRGTELNTKLNNANIEISGYLLPLNFEQGKANEFLLVPWVGACIHTPAPPKNQIIFVKTKDWMDAVELFDPVMLSGKLSVEEQISDLFLGDGTTQINTGYSIINGTIFKF